MIARMFDTALDPDDVERAKELFLTMVKPRFEELAGCHGVEMFIGIEEHSGDLVDMVTTSHWESLEHIEAALTTAEYKAMLGEFSALFRQTPIIRHFTVAGN